MRKHVTIIGWLYLIHGGLILLGGLIAFMAMTFGGLLSGDLGDMIARPVAGIVTALVVGIFSLPAILIGWERSPPVCTNH